MNNTRMISNSTIEELLPASPTTLSIPYLHHQVWIATTTTAAAAATKNDSLAATWNAKSVKRCGENIHYDKSGHVPLD